MLHRVKRRGADESGAVLALVAIMMVVFLGMAALAIDVGSFYQAQRQAQSAADAGALAGSQDLPNNTAGAATDATTYAQRNFPGATVNVTTNYNSTPKDIKVTVNTSAPAFFGQIFGITHANVSASAVAGGNGKSQQAAIFAYADGGNCSTDAGLTIDKNNAQITGGIQSDGNLTDSGGGTTQIGAGVYGTGSGCGFTGSSGNFTTPPGVYAEPPTGYPLDYRTTNTPVCGVGPTYNFTGAHVFTGTIAPGVYCNPTGTFDFNNATGTGVTFVANGIGVTGGNSNTLTAPGSAGAYGLLLYQTGCDATAGHLTISGNSVTLNGTIFAPCATVDITQNNSSTGFIEANNVHISFNNFTITGDGPVVAGSGDGLLQ